MENNTTTNTVAVNNKEEKKMENTVNVENALENVVENVNTVAVKRTDMKAVIKSLKKAIVIGSSKFIEMAGNNNMITIENIDVSLSLGWFENHYYHNTDNMKFEIDVKNETVDIYWDSAFLPTLSGAFDVYSDFIKTRMTTKKWNDFTNDLFPPEVSDRLKESASSYAYGIAYDFAKKVVGYIIDDIEIKVVYSVGKLYHQTANPEKIFNQFNVWRNLLHEEEAEIHRLLEEKKKQPVSVSDDDDEFI